MLGVALVGCSSAKHRGLAASPSTTSSAPSVSSSAVTTTSTTSPGVSPGKTVSAVGPLFLSGTDTDHLCTASVVNTAAGNVIMTAAHCVFATGKGIVFAPGYDNGTAPHGTWIAQKAYAATAWVNSQDEKEDVALLVVAPAPSNNTADQRPVQAVVGGYDLGVAPAAGDKVTLVGYIIGHGDEPLICDGSVYATRGFPSVDCPGYAEGTSGGPWLLDYDRTKGTGTVGAVIGGLQQGGCLPDTSYSSPFDASTKALLARATAGGPGDNLPFPKMPHC